MSIKMYYVIFSLTVLLFSTYLLFTGFVNLGCYLISTLLAIHIVIIILGEEKVMQNKTLVVLENKLNDIADWIMKPHPFILHAFISSCFLSFGAMYLVHEFVLESICNKFICLPIFALMFFLCVIVFAIMFFVFAFFGSELNDKQNGRDVCEESTVKYTLRNVPVYALVGFGLTLSSLMFFVFFHVISFLLKSIAKCVNRPKVKTFR